MHPPVNYPNKRIKRVQRAVLPPPITSKLFEGVPQRNSTSSLHPVSFPPGRI